MALAYNQVEKSFESYAAVLHLLIYVIRKLSKVDKSEVFCAFGNCTVDHSSKFNHASL